jgi:hypothetical protein
MNQFKALKDPNSVPLKQGLGLAAQLLKRLFPKEGKNLQDAEITENEKVLSMRKS